MLKVFKRKSSFRHFKMHEHFFGWDIASGWIIIVQCKMPMWAVELALGCEIVKSHFLHFVSFAFSQYSFRVQTVFLSSYNISPSSSSTVIAVTITTKMRQTTVRTWIICVEEKWQFQRKTNIGLTMPSTNQQHDSTTRMIIRALSPIRWVFPRSAWLSLFALVKCLSELKCSCRGNCISI